MNTNQLKKFAQIARNRLLNDVTRRFLYWGINDQGIVEHKVESTTGGYIFRNNVFNDSSVPKKWENLNKAVQLHTANDIVEEASYTWFNRLIAIKILEKNGYDESQISYSENGIDPIILQNSKRGITPKMDEQAKRQLQEYITNSQDDEALSLLLIHYCKSHKLLNRLFGRIDDYTELLLPNNLLAKDGIIELINNEEYISDDDYKEVELIGWLYQFYIADKKDDVFASFKKKQKARAEDIPAATQIFTPKWIVKYLVENTAGRIWLDKHKESPIRDTMKYLVEPEDAKSSDPIIDDVEELKVLDPAVGSGHFLVVAFDLLMQMYLESGYSKSNAVESIITHNLYGLDLCKRAVGLANFAILLKGASYSPDILTKQIKPHIYAMPEPYEFSRQQINDFLGGNGHHYADELADALTQMQQAQNIGSALVIDLSSSTRDFIAKRLNDFNEKQKRIELDLTEIGVLNRINPFLHPILMLTDTYPAVVANPPYMGSKNMNADLKLYINNHYPMGKADLFAVFMEVCINRNMKNGLMGMINLPSWMFLSSFEKLREHILQNTYISTLIHQGRGIFGSDFGSVCFCLKKSPDNNKKGVYRRLFKEHVKVDSVKEKERRFLDNEYGYFKANQNSFENIPGNPIAYWVSDNVSKVFGNSKTFNDYTVLKSGKSTNGKNEEWFRFWHEISLASIDFNNNKYHDINNKYVPLNKGGAFRKWYGNIELVTNNEFCTDDKYLFNEGLTWSDVTSGSFSCRYHKVGTVSNNVGKMAYPRIEHDYFILLAIMNTKQINWFLDIIIPTIHYDIGYVGNMPIIVPNSINTCQYVITMSKNNISLSKSDWDSRENSWDFKELPLLNNSSSLPTSYTIWEEKVTEDFFKLHENEEELNRIFIDIYGLQDELDSNVALKDITILKEELDRGELESRNGELLTNKTGLPIKKDVVIKQLLSYAAGCFMGRYRLDKPGLNIAHPGSTEEELSAYSYHDNTFEIDDDAIIPTMGSDSPFSDDIVARTKEFIQMVWGDESLTENLNFINEALGENIEKYLTKKFWADHKKTYKKKPIYWEFASAKGAFKVIVYMHRMNRFTVQKIRQNYLFKQINWLDKQIDHLLQNESSLTSQELRKLDNYRKDLIECRDFDLLLKDVSDKQIEFDLDDGVTVNYKLFDGVVSKI